MHNKQIDELNTLKNMLIILKNINKQNVNKEHDIKEKQKVLVLTRKRFNKIYKVV